MANDANQASTAKTTNGESPGKDAESSDSLSPILGGSEVRTSETDRGNRAHGRETIE